MENSFFSLWKKDKSVLDQARETAIKMLKQDELMFRAAVDALAENRKPAIDIYHKDYKLNLAEMEIKKIVLTHLSINPKQDVTSALILTSIVSDIERIGDYTKNILELGELYTKEYKEDKYAKRLLDVEKKIMQQFGLTIKALTAESAKDAEEVIRLYRKDINKELKPMLRQILKDSALKKQEAVISALLLRYLKRVGAHLMNIATSITNPYHAMHYSDKTVADFEEGCALDLNGDDDEAGEK